MIQRASFIKNFRHTTSQVLFFCYCALTVSDDYFQSPLGQNCQELNNYQHVYKIVVPILNIFTNNKDHISCALKNSLIQSLPTYDSSSIMASFSVLASKTRGCLLKRWTSTRGGGLIKQGELREVGGGGLQQCNVSSTDRLFYIWLETVSNASCEK